MSDPRHRLRILHISDLHERGPREKEPWRRRRVLGGAWDRNLAELLQDGPVDLVCFTGDAADWGLETEYGPVTAASSDMRQTTTGTRVSRFKLAPRYARLPDDGLQRTDSKHRMIRHRHR